MTADLHPDTGLPRPGTCCGVCPPIAGGGWDCTCAGNIRCQTAADLPSVTDDARAEAERRWGDRRTSDRLPSDWLDEGMASGFVLGAQWAAGRAETTTGAIARGEALSAGDPDWSNVTRRAETTTATTEDAGRRLYDALRRAWPEGYADPEEVTNWPYWEAIARDAGLLATARTRPTRDDISDAIEHSGIAIGTVDAEQAADAVLALLEGGGDR